MAPRLVPRRLRLRVGHGLLRLDDVATIAGRAADALGMVFAGIDVKDPGTGEYTVLDVNPSPMFASLSEMAGIDIAGALASRLAAGSAR